MSREHLRDVELQPLGANANVINTAQNSTLLEAAQISAVRPSYQLRALARLLLFY
jgi:hypothetical protein